MKIIITENKLRDLQLQYLNQFVDDVSEFDTVIVLWYPSNGDDDEFERDALMEYDSYDGRLYIAKSFLDNFGKVYFPNDDDAGPFIKDWFENYFGVEIKYTQS
jgi:hypothetical protein